MNLERFEVEVRQKITDAQAMYDDPNADGYSIYLKLKAALVEQGELDFLKSIADFPFCVEADNFDPVQIQENLVKEFRVDSYLAFPTTAAGKYSNCIHNIYFKTNSDAVFFKLKYL